MCLKQPLLILFLGLGVELVFSNVFFFARKYSFDCIPSAPVKPGGAQTRLGTWRWKKHVKLD